MSNPGPIKGNRDLLSELKQAGYDAKVDHAPDDVKDHIAGATGKLASAIAQHQGTNDLSKGRIDIDKQVPMSGGPVDKSAVQASLDARAVKKMSKDDGDMDKGSEAARLQSAAEQYRLANEGKTTMDMGTRQEL